MRARLLARLRDEFTAEDKAGVVSHALEMGEDWRPERLWKLMAVAFTSGRSLTT